jgi:DNA-binding GntR family transcriptional regulator
VADRQNLTGEWLHANHEFHDIIYRVAGHPYVEQMAKSARRTFSSRWLWLPAGPEIDELYDHNERQHCAIREALAARSASGARALAREHVLSSFTLLSTILERIGSASRSRRPNPLPFPAPAA